MPTTPQTTVVVSFMHLRKNEIVNIYLKQEEDEEEMHKPVKFTQELVISLV